MGKLKEQSIGHTMYVEHGKTAKEISATINVSERTIGEWVKKFKWKEQRDAKLNAPKERIENIKRVISNLSEQALQLQLQRKVAVTQGNKEAIADIDATAVGLSDQISKWNKALAVMDKDSRITLNVYLQVMEDVFNNLKIANNSLFMQTLDFQSQHVQFISQKLG